MCSSDLSLIGMIEPMLAHAQDVKRGLTKARLHERKDEADLQALWAQAKASTDDTVKLVQLVAKADTGDMTPAAYFTRVSNDIGAQFKFSASVLKVLHERLNERRQIVVNKMLAVVIGLSAMIGLAWLISRFIQRSVLRAVEQAGGAAEALSRGDLTVQVHSDARDELGTMVRAISEGMSRLRGLVSEMQSASVTVAHAAAEIAQGNQDLSQRTENQASSLQETAASMEQISSMVRTNAGTAQQANDLARDASQDASQSGGTFREVVGKMHAIRDASRRIAEINAVIDGIAFQTNILALNAAVEAARAGEQGRGFAVVAAEVRSLAQRSANAAREIKALISQSTDTVEEGYQLAESTGQGIESLVARVSEVSHLMETIAQGNDQQQLGIEQVNQAVSHLDQGTQQNAALVEQASAAAHSLSDQARRLQEAAGAFRLN